MLLVGLVGVLDVWTGYQLALSIFYLVPIVIVTWTAGRRAGFLLALGAGVVWLGADLIGARPDAYFLLPYWNAAVRIAVFGFIVLTLTGFKAERHAARSDALTGLANRHALFEAAELELERARRYGRPVSLIYVDCDDFKRVNDRLGHAAGDELLWAIATAFEVSTRPTDLAARVGGDEFAVLMPETGPDAAPSAAARLRDRLVEAADSGGWAVTFSIGCVSFVVAPPSVDELVNAADYLMYEAKRSGKNSVRSAQGG